MGKSGAIRFLAFNAPLINEMCFLRPPQLSENLNTTSRPFRPKIAPSHTKNEAIPANGVTAFGVVCNFSS
ncbi:MAG: hypothetical protein CAK90_00525 [Spartobacteria bacterium AMD-G4]|nr:MAG: hypothetical protein CAK90_00525 [Spartobacteria bacterium AMD-G4]